MSTRPQYGERYVVRVSDIKESDYDLVSALRGAGDAFDISAVIERHAHLSKTIMRDSLLEVLANDEHANTVLVAARVAKQHVVVQKAIRVILGSPVLSDDLKKAVQDDVERRRAEGDGGGRGWKNLPEEEQPKRRFWKF